MERNAVHPDQSVEPRRNGPRVPEFRHGDFVLHDGHTWTVIEDTGKNIRLINDHSRKTVLPEAVKPLAH